MHFEYISNVNEAHTKILMNYSLFQHTKSEETTPSRKYFLCYSAKSKSFLIFGICRCLTFIHVFVAEIVPANDFWVMI